MFLGKRKNKLFILTTKFISLPIIKIGKTSSYRFQSGDFPFLLIGGKSSARILFLKLFDSFYKNQTVSSIIVDLLFQNENDTQDQQQARQFRSVHRYPTLILKYDEQTPVPKADE